MKIEILGCHGGVDPHHDPVTFLLDDSILLDAGTIVKELSLERQGKIKSILITHCHMDHIKDLCFLADNLVLTGKDSVNVIGLPVVLRMLKRYVMNNKIWPDFFEIQGKKGTILKLMPLKAGEQKNLNRSYVVEIVETTHSSDSSAYIITKNDTCIVYSGDTGPTEKMWKRLNKIKNLKAIFIEVSFPNRMKKFALTSGHLTPALLMKEVGKLKNWKNIKFFLMHMKPPFLDEIEKEISELPIEDVKILREGEVVYL